MERERTMFCRISDLRFQISNCKRWIASLTLAMTMTLSLIASAADLGEIEVVSPDQTPSSDESAVADVITPPKGEIKSTTELLEQTPGVYIKRYGSNEDAATVSIRGATYNQINIFYDNIPLNSANGNTIDFSLIPPENISRIEIYKGGAPARAPDPSPSGAIFFNTLKRPEKLKIKASGAYGSFDTFKGYLQFTQPVKDAWYLVSFDHSQSEGDFTYRDDNGTRSNTADDVTRTRQNNDFTAENLLTKFGWQSGDIDISASNTLFIKRQGIPGLGLFRSSKARLDTDRNITIFNGSYKKTAATLFFDYLNSRFSDPDGDIGLGKQNNDNNTYRFGAELAQSYDKISHNAFYAALTQRGEYFMPKNYASARTTGSTSWRQQLGLVAEDTITLFSDRLTLTPSVRGNIIFNHLSNDDPSISIGTTSTFDKNAYQWTGKFGVKFRAVSDLYVKANIYRGFRNPDFMELFGDRGTIVGNPNLRPEEALNVDGGLAYEISNLGWLDRLKVEATYFRNSTKDLIQFIQTSQMTAKAENISSSLVQGFEGSVLIGYLSHVTHSVSYTFQDAKDTGNTVTSGKYIPGMPKNQIWFDTSVYNDLGSIYGEYNFISGNYLDTQNILEVTGRTFVNLGASITPAKWVNINFTAKNITNDQTFDVIGFPLPGRSYWGAVTFTI